MDLWVSIALVLVGFLAIFLELFVPAGGLVGLGGFISMVLGIIFAYMYQGNIAGTLLLIAAVIGTPVSLAIAFKVFPHTFVGKRLILSETQRQDTGYTASTGAKYAGLIGKEGVALSALRPSGTARIGNDKFSVVTEGAMIDPGARVKVVNVEGSRIVVRSC